MSLVWQVDFYRSPLQDESKQVLWELFICNPTRSFEFIASCPQSLANSTWLIDQFKLANDGNLPDVIQVFRPQSLNLIAAAGAKLGIKTEPTRRTLSLKQWLQEKHYPILIDQPPPLPLPENLWGENWRLATIPAGNLVNDFIDRPIPVLHIPEFLQPISLGLASTLLIPGVVIYGGRQSMRLTRWLQGIDPVSLNYVAGTPDGLILAAGLADRWILVTFTDPEVSAAARLYQQRKQLTQGLHFLLVQPDDSDMTYSGFWLLQTES